MAIKIPLKMSDGTTVRTIEELREHFNLVDVLGYYEDGRLAKWLLDGYYDEEVEKVKALDSSSKEFRKDLCNILGVDYKKYGKLDKDVLKKKERLERLKQYTDDDRILTSVDSVAFTQEELEELLEKADTLETDEDEDDYDNAVIYLCGEHFIIPSDIESITFKGVNKPNPTVTLDGDEIGWDIDLQDLEFDIISYVDAYIDFDGDDDNVDFFDAFEHSSELGVKLLRIEAEKGSVAAQITLAECYRRGFGIEKNDKESKKWLLKAAEQGDVSAQLQLGIDYHYGQGVKKDYKEAVKWYRKAAKQGHEEAEELLNEILEWLNCNSEAIDYDDDAFWEDVFKRLVKKPWDVRYGLPKRN